MKEFVVTIDLPFWSESKTAYLRADSQREAEDKVQRFVEVSFIKEEIRFAPY